MKKTFLVFAVSLLILAGVGIAHSEGIKEYNYGWAGWMMGLMHNNDMHEDFSDDWHEQMHESMHGDEFSYEDMLANCPMHRRQ